MPNGPIQLIFKAKVLGDGQEFARLGPGRAIGVDTLHITHTQCVRSAVLLCGCGFVFLVNMGHAALGFD